MGKRAGGGEGMEMGEEGGLKGVKSFSKKSRECGKGVGSWMQGSSLVECFLWFDFENIQLLIGSFGCDSLGRKSEKKFEV